MKVRLLLLCSAEVWIEVFKCSYRHVGGFGEGLGRGRGDFRFVVCLLEFGWFGFVWEVRWLNWDFDDRIMKLPLIAFRALI